MARQEGQRRRGGEHRQRRAAGVRGVDRRRGGWEPHAARCYFPRRLETTALRGEQALEEHLVPLAGDRPADLRTQAARELRRDLDASACG